MSLRETLNQNQPVVIGVVVVAVLIAAYFIFRQVSPSTPSTASSAFFTIDDGATYFSDDIRKTPPFDKDGKQAVRAYVFSCGSDKFVGYLERFTPEYKAQVAKLGDLTKGGQPGPAMGAEIGKLQALSMSGREIKKPGAKDWSKAFGPRIQDIIVAKCKDGNNAEAVQP